MFLFVALLTLLASSSFCSALVCTPTESLNNPLCTTISATLVVPSSWTTVQVENAFPLVDTIQGALVLDSLASLSDISGIFPELVDVTTLRLCNLTALPTTSVAAFPKLETVSTLLDISDNDALVTLDGFPLLTSVGTLAIRQNPVLSSVIAFSSIAATFNGDLDLRANPSLASIDSLQLLKVRTLTGVFFVSPTSAPLLALFTKLKNVAALLIADDPGVVGGTLDYTVPKSVGDKLRIDNLQQLTTVRLYTSDKNIDTSLEVTNCASLERLELLGLRKIKASLIVTNNTALRHIATSSLRFITDDLEIRNNLALRSIAMRLSLKSIGGQATIVDNPQLCTGGVASWTPFVNPPNLTMSNNNPADGMPNCLVTDLNEFEAEDAAGDLVNGTLSIIDTLATNNAFATTDSPAQSAAVMLTSLNKVNSFLVNNTLSLLDPSNAPIDPDLDLASSLNATLLALDTVDALLAADTLPALRSVASTSSLATAAVNAVRSTALQQPCNTLRTSNGNRFSSAFSTRSTIASATGIHAIGTSAVTLPAGFATAVSDTDAKLSAFVSCSIVVQMVTYAENPFSELSTNQSDPALVLDSPIVSFVVGDAQVNGLADDDAVIVDLVHANSSRTAPRGCYYWSFDLDAWSTDGCTVLSSSASSTRCRCNHLTNFAVLFKPSEETFPLPAPTVNECASNPCLNGATCLDLEDSFLCLCAVGYTSAICAVDMDECDSSPCENGGACSDAVAGYSCNCVGGFAGVTCSVNLDECASMPCQNGATCLDAAYSFTCSCPAGFFGLLCDLETSECESSPCQNGATCQDISANLYTCSCLAGWTGAMCSDDADVCVSSPCQNGATCVESPAPGGGHSCTCALGYTGLTCALDINECASSPCQNGAVCVDGVSAFTCSCLGVFTGELCETEITYFELAAATVARNVGGSISSGNVTLTVPVGALKEVSEDIIVGRRATQSVVGSEPSAYRASIIYTLLPAMDFTTAVRITIPLGSPSPGYSRVLYYRAEGSDWEKAGNQVIDDVLSTISGDLMHFSDVGVFYTSSTSPLAVATNVVSLLGCIISIIACTALLLIFSYLPRLRTTPILVVMQLSVALILVNVIFSAGINQTQNAALCQFSKLALYYSVMSVFMWMFASAALLWRAIVLNKLSESVRSTTVACVLLWLLPLLPTAVLAIVDQTQGSSTSSSVCWFKSGPVLTWAFLVPLGVVLVFDFAILFMCVRVFYRSYKANKRLRKSNSSSERWQHLRAMIIFCMTTGTTWVLSYIALAVDSDVVWLLFAAVNGFQGLWLFFAYGLSRRTRAELASKWEARSTRTSSNNKHKRNDALRRGGFRAPPKRGETSVSTMSRTESSSAYSDSGMSLSGTTTEGSSSDTQMRLRDIMRGRIESFYEVDPDFVSSIRERYMDKTQNAIKEWVDEEQDSDTDSNVSADFCPRRSARRSLIENEGLSPVATPTTLRRFGRTNSDVRQSATSFDDCAQVIDEITLQRIGASATQFPDQWLDDDKQYL